MELARPEELGFSPARLARITAKPVVQGPQTAIIVGKKGEEIDTDEFGRVKVQFHWDRYGKADETSNYPVIDSTADWYQVTIPGGTKGWVMATYVKEVQ